MTMTTTKKAAPKAVAEVHAEAAKNIDIMVQNNRKALDQIVESSNESYEKIVATAKDRFQQVMSVVDEAKETNEGNIDAMIAAGNASMKAMETLSSEMISFGKQAWEDQISAVKASMGAKSVQEAMDLQRDFAKSYIDGFVAQASKLSEMVPQLTKDALEPFNARAKAHYDKFVKSTA
jgi:phasin family protein